MFDDLFNEMRRLQRKINRSFENFWKNNEYRELPDRFENYMMRSPLTDLEETDKEIIVRFELPGVNKKDIQLNVTENKIEVKVEKKDEVRIEKKGFFRMERGYAGFYRAIALPENVYPEKSRAKYENGILEVVMPKTEAKKKSKIEIK